MPAGTMMADFKVALPPENFVKGALGTWGAPGGVFALILRCSMWQSSPRSQLGCREPRM
jgi:hypothetical protein